MKIASITLAATVLMASQAAADGHASGLIGATVVITNTFQGAQTEGAEVDVSAFDLLNNQFATVGDDVEFPAFITLYDVDVSAGAIQFAWGDSPFAQQLSGPTPEGNHDRNYFVFDLPEGKAITEISFDAAASDMIEGSAEPTATILGPNRIVIDFSTGVIRGAGFNPAFAITVSDAEG